MNVRHFVHFLFRLLPKKEYAPPSYDVIALMRFFTHSKIAEDYLCAITVWSCGFDAVVIVHLTSASQQWLSLNLIHLNQCETAPVRTKRLAKVRNREDIIRRGAFVAFA